MSQEIDQFNENEQPKLLWIEDNTEFIADINESFSRSGYLSGSPPVIRSATNAKEGLEILTKEKEPFSAIITDLKLTGRDSGIDLIDKVRELPKYQKTPIIIVTDLNESSISIGGKKYDLSEILDKGVNKYIEKRIFIDKDIDFFYQIILDTMKGNSLNYQYSDKSYVIFKIGTYTTGLGVGSSIISSFTGLEEIRLFSAASILTGNFLMGLSLIAGRKISKYRLNLLYKSENIMSKLHPSKDDNKIIKDWYILLKDEAPTAAIGIICIGIGFFLLITSGSAKEPINLHFIKLGNAFSWLGFIGFFISMIVTLFKSTKK